MHDEYYCPNCNAVLNDQEGFDPDLGSWMCTECGETLYGDDVESTMEEFDGVVWICDSCGAVLNKQSGFYDSCGTWCCTECGYENSISEDEIYDSEADYEDRNKHKCPECGEFLEDQYSFYEDEGTHTCSNCDTELFRDEDEDEYKVLYRCPKCDEILNKQIGFNDYYYEWECDECGVKLIKEYDGFHIENEEENEVDENEKENEEVKNNSEDNYSDSTNWEYYEKRIREEERRSLLEAQEEITKREKAKEKRNKRNELYKKHWKGILVLLAVVCIGCFGGYKYYMYQRSIPVGVSSEELVGQDYKAAMSALERAGFTKVTSEPKYDINIEEVDVEGKVESVSIDGQDTFTSDKRYQFDAAVIVFYHKIKDIKVPLSAKEAKKMQYKDLDKKLKDAGFVNIKLEPKYDLIKGWLKKEGSVKSVAINGDSSFEANTSYRPDAEIIIVYHALRKDKKD